MTTDDEVTFTVDLDQLSHEDLRRCFSMLFFSVHEFVDAIAGGDEEAAKRGLELVAAARDEVVMRLYEKRKDEGA